MRLSMIWFLICWSLYPLARIGVRGPYIAAFRRYSRAVPRDGGRRGRLPAVTMPAWP